MRSTIWKSLLCVLLILVVANCTHSLLFSSRTKQCKTNYPGRCQCNPEMYDGVQKFVTKCINSMFNNASVLKRLPPKTEVLIFKGNNITVIPSNAFGKSFFSGVYKKLEVIDLSNNAIFKLQKGAFNHIPSLKKLILNNNWLVVDNVKYFVNMNALQELHLKSAFYFRVEDKRSISMDIGHKELMTFFNNNPLNNLKVLHLEENNVTLLNMKIFCAFPKLSHLYLAKNNIDNIVWKTRCLHSLRYMDVSNNRLPYLEKSIVVQLESNKNMTVDLTNNSFVCDCHMKYFYDWLHRTNMSLVGKENYACNTPIANMNVSILALPRKNLKCKGVISLIRSFLSRLWPRH